MQLHLEGGNYQKLKLCSISQKKLSSFWRSWSTHVLPVWFIQLCTQLNDISFASNCAHEIKLTLAIFSGFTFLFLFQAQSVISVQEMKQGKQWELIHVDPSCDDIFPEINRMKKSLTCPGPFYCQSRKIYLEPYCKLGYLSE